MPSPGNDSTPTADPSLRGCLPLVLLGLILWGLLFALCYLWIEHLVAAAVLASFGFAGVWLAVWLVVALLFESLGTRVRKALRAPRLPPGSAPPVGGAGAPDVRLVPPSWQWTFAAAILGGPVLVVLLVGLGIALEIKWLLYSPLIVSAGFIGISLLDMLVRALTAIYRWRVLRGIAAHPDAARPTSMPSPAEQPAGGENVQRRTDIEPG